jgi:hypothetical protein
MAMFELSSDDVRTLFQLATFNQPAPKSAEGEIRQNIAR